MSLLFRQKKQQMHRVVFDVDIKQHNDKIHDFVIYLSK